MSGSSGVSTQRRARLAAKRQTLMLVNVPEEQVLNLHSLGILDMSANLAKLDL